MKDLNTNLLRKRERDEKQDEIKRQEFLLAHPKVEDKAQVRKNIDQLKGTLEKFSPEPLNGPEKDKLYALEKRLAARIAEGMPSDETMRKNPVGAVHQHTLWEKTNKKLIKWWKNCRIQLNPESDDRDLANVERLRRPGQMDRLRTDAQIPGHMAFNDISPDDWPFTPPQNTALEQAKKAERDRMDKIALSVEIAEKTIASVEPIVFETGKHRRNLTEAQRQVLRERMNRVRGIRDQKRAARKAAMAAGVPAGNQASVAAPAV